MLIAAMMAKHDEWRWREGDYIALALLTRAFGGMVPLPVKRPLARFALHKIIIERWSNA